MYITILSKKVPKNLISNGVNYGNWSIAGTGTTKGANGIHLMDDGTVENASVSVNLKTSTVYTLAFVLTDKSVTAGSLALTGSTIVASDTILPMNIAQNKFKFTTASTITSNTLKFKITTGSAGNYFDIKDIILVEGDYTSLPLTYRG